MAISKRVLARRNSRGETTTRTVWRSRIADPMRPGAASHKVEKTFATRADAVRWETSQRSAIASGSYVTPQAGATTLSSVADAWRATWNAKPLSPKTQQGYASVLATHVLPRWGDVKVSAIDAKSIQQWVNGLADKRHAETVHHAYTALRQCMKVAVAHKLIAVNPCTPDSITLPSKRAANATREQLFLDASELRQLVNAMPEHWRLATLLSGLCGTRAGETWAIRRGDVDLLRNRLTISYALKDISGKLIAGPTKSHQRRSLTIPAPLIEPLHDLLSSPGVRVRRVARNRPLFPGGYPAIVNGELTWTDEAQDPDRLLFSAVSGGPVNHSNFAARVFEPTRDALWPTGRLSKLRWHDLRHTAASLAIAATGNLGIVQKRLGHSSISLTYDRYGHMLPEADKSLADTLGSMYDATDEPSNVVDLHAGEA
jgi:integrase